MNWTPRARVIGWTILIAAAILLGMFSAKWVLIGPG